MWGLLFKPPCIYVRLTFWVTLYTDILWHLRLAYHLASLFGHIARLDTTVPAHLALWLQTDITIGRKHDASWRRTPGRPRKTWISQIQEDVNMSAHSYWDASTRRGHGRMTQRSFMTTRSWWYHLLAAHQNASFKIVERHSKYTSKMFEFLQNYKFHVLVHTYKSIYFMSIIINTNILTHYVYMSVL